MQSLQTLGGSGYLQDYPIEQYIRDAKIDSLYEGTTAIQSLDFLFRKIVRDNGQALAHVAGEIAAFLDAEGGNGRLKEERALLPPGARRRPGHARLADRLPGRVAGGPDEHLQGRPAHRPAADGGRRPARSAGCCCARPRSRWPRSARARRPKDKAFYEGKVAVAPFFAKTVLPRLTAAAAIIENADNALMELDEAAF